MIDNWICPDCKHENSIAIWVCDNCHFQIDDPTHKKYIKPAEERQPAPPLERE